MKRLFDRAVKRNREVPGVHLEREISPQADIEQKGVRQRGADRERPRSDVDVVPTQETAYICTRAPAAQTREKREQTKGKQMLPISHAESA
jgi:hypothetical protein